MDAEFPGAPIAGPACHTFRGCSFQGFDDCDNPHGLFTFQMSQVTDYQKMIRRMSVIIDRKGSIVMRSRKKRNLLIMWDDLGNRAGKRQCHERHEAR